MKKVVEVSTETLYVRLREVLDSRGKKTLRADTVSLLERVLGVAVTPVQQVKVLMTLIAARLETN